MFYIGGMRKQSELVLKTNDPSVAAEKVVEMVSQAADAMKARYASTVSSQPDRGGLQILTALEELRKVQDAATWGSRMLIELAGAAKKQGDKKAPSQRAMVAASGVSLASVHEWINHPAMGDEESSGPGTLPKPGQTRHRFSGNAADDSYDEDEDF